MTGLWIFLSVLVIANYAEDMLHDWIKHKEDQLKQGTQDGTKL